MSTADLPPPGAPKPPLALIAGPTGSGKSDLAVRLARHLQADARACVVINADSAQVYADLPILSAQPTPDERHGISHRLFGVWDGAIACSAADWANAARAEIAAAHAEGALPILVGGTGLYIRTLLDGIAPMPAIDSKVRAIVRAMPVAQAYAALLREDPTAAARLAPRDTTRVARALEVIRATGRPIGLWQAARHGGIGDAVTLHAVVLEAERGWLNARCDARFAAMVERGALAEVARLSARALDAVLPVMRAIGVREIAAYLDGQRTLAEAIAAGQRATRQYAKRQATWLRHQCPSDWPRIPADDAWNGVASLDYYNISR